MNRWLPWAVLLGGIAGTCLQRGVGNPVYPPQQLQTYSASRSSGSEEFYLKKILAAVESIDARLARTETQKAVEALPRTLPQAMIAFKCAGCHTDGKLKGEKNKKSELPV